VSDDIIISVENLGKRYSLRHQTGEPYTALRDVITEKCRDSGGKALTSLAQLHLDGAFVKRDVGGAFLVAD
jgi:hypothetical protein